MSTQPTTHPDLEALRRSEPVASAPRRRWLPRITATVLVLGLLAAGYSVLKPLFFPPRAVRLAGVVLPTGEDSGTSRTSFVQAAGWIEADPFPVSVRPLVRGIVEKLHVVEGTKVTQGETVIGTLRNADIENALTTAKAQLTLMKSIHKHRETSLAVARTILEQKIELRAAVAEHEGGVSTARAEVDRAAARRKVAEASLERARVDLKAQHDLRAAGHATPTALATAEAAVSEAEERVREVRFEEVRFVANLERIKDLLELAREAVRDPRVLQGKVDEAEAAVHHAHADVLRAEADVEVAQRNVDLLTIKAPMSGTVLRLESAPGASVGPGGEFKGSGEGAGSTGMLNRMTGSLCSIYEPTKLQVRVDVPYADLPGIARGTEVELEAKALPGKKLSGVVDRLVREADITQAKLQVKVRITEPDPRLRPEMIVTARFLVKPEQGATKSTTKRGPTRVLVPSEAVRGGAVFVFDPTGGGKARRIPVSVIREADGMSEVDGELGLSSKVILDEVEHGEAVKEQR